jgi:hypothetical protein
MVCARLVCFCFLGALAATAANADPITYSESESGDLAELLPTPTVFTFDVGVNTVSGRVRSAPDEVSDFDSLAFSIPAGTALSAVRYSFVTSFLPSVTTPATHFALFPGNLRSGPFLALDTIAAPSRTLGEATVFASALPLRAGTYGAWHIGMSFSGDRSGFSQDYTWSFTVTNATAPIPEPASLSLVGLALAGMGVRQRRQRNRR